MSFALFCISVGKELNRTCRAMQQRIVELISRVSNEEVTEELLHVNDDLNNIFLRYERYLLLTVEGVQFVCKSCIFYEYFVLLRYERFRSGRTVHGVNNGVRCVLLPLFFFFTLIYTLMY